MSLIGIDVGSSSVKIAAYSVDGKLLRVVNNELTPLHPQPGWWEQDPEEVWQATARGLGELVSLDPVRRDPPRALAVSASGRENFPADADGKPLGNNKMGADIRGEEFEVPPRRVPPSPNPGRSPVVTCAREWIRCSASCGGVNTILTYWKKPDSTPTGMVS